MDNMPFPAALIDDIPQVCVLCGIYFSNALSLQYHMRLHTGLQEPSLYESRPPPPPVAPSTTTSPTNGSLTPSVGSNVSSATSNTSMPKHDLELGLEFLNSLTQMYANPTASRENKEKGYDFRYEPNTSSQIPFGTQDAGKHNESQKYNFDDFYNSPGDDMLDKKFESVLDFELSKDNGMHFGSLKEPLESVLDETLSVDEKDNEKVVDTVSQLYHNELEKELDKMSNESLRPEEENKFNNIKITDLAESESEEKNTGENPLKDLPVSQNNDSHSKKDSPSFEDEIPKVGKFMKIKKYFQSQEMRKKERNSVEKTEVTCMTNASQSEEKTDRNQKETVSSVDEAPRKTEQNVIPTIANSSVSSETKSSENKVKKDITDSPKVDSKDSSDHEEIAINLKSLRKRPNKVEEQDKKKHNVRKRANPRRCVRKGQIDEKLKELAKDNEDKKETDVSEEQVKEVETEEVAVKEKKAEEIEIEEKTEKVEIEKANEDTPVVNEINTETAEEMNDKMDVTLENMDSDNQQQEKVIISELQLNAPLVEPITLHLKEIKSDSEMSETEDSDSAYCTYGQEAVEPLKIKIWKIKPHKKKKHKVKKRKKHRKDRSSTETLVGYTEMTNFDFADDTKAKHKHKAKRYREKKHSCGNCGQGFGQRCDLRKHMMIHTGERPWVCVICEKTFQRKTDLVKHTRIHTGEKPYECEYCGKKVSDKSQLNVHRRLHTGVRPYQCDICSKGCITSSELTRHRQTHSSDRPWKCEICQKGFKLKECLAMHMKIHNGTKKYQCAKCGLGFDSESKMEHHLLLHEIDNPYMCRECGADFENQAHYANHIKSHKREQRGPYSCDYCGRLFEYKSSLDPHLRTHTGEKPFICELCNNAYSLKGNLKHHMKVHHGNCFYKCATCGENFHLKRDLVNHSKIHPEDQLHCHYCDSHFQDQETADNHRDECSLRKSYQVDDTDNPTSAGILDNIDDEFAKSYTPQGKIDQPPVRDRKELEKIYEFDDSDSETKTKVKSSAKKDSHSHTSPRSKDLHMSPRSRDYHSRMSPKGAKRSRDPEIPKPLTISALLNSPPMNKKQKSIPQPKSDKVDPFQGEIDKSAVLSNKDDELDIFQRRLDTERFGRVAVDDPSTAALPNLSVSDKNDLFENIIESSDIGQSKDSAPIPFTSSLTSTTESSVFSSKDSIDSLLATAPVITQQQTNVPETSKPEISSVTQNFPSYNWKNDLAPTTDYVNSLLMKSLNGPSASASCNKFDAEDSLSKFNLDYLNPLIMKTLNADLKFDSNENLQKSTPFYPVSTASSNVLSPPAASYPYKSQFSAPSETRVDTYTTADYMTSLARTIGMPNVEKLAMDYLYQSSVASDKQDFHQKFGLTGKTDPSVPLPSFNYLNTVASNQDTLNDALDMSAFSGLPSMSAFTRNSEFSNAHLAAPSAYGALDITKSLPSGEKIDEAAALLSNFEYGT